MATIFTTVFADNYAAWSSIQAPVSFPINQSPRIFWGCAGGYAASPCRPEGLIQTVGSYTSPLQTLTFRCQMAFSIIGSPTGERLICKADNSELAAGCSNNTASFLFLSTLSMLPTGAVTLLIPNSDGSPGLTATSAVVEAFDGDLRGYQYSLNFTSDS